MIQHFVFHQVLITAGWTHLGRPKCLSVGIELSPFDVEPGDLFTWLNVSMMLCVHETRSPRMFQTFSCSIIFFFESEITHTDFGPGGIQTPQSSDLWATTYAILPMSVGSLLPKLLI